MKVFYDHQIFVTQKFGGISRYFYEIIKRISNVCDVGLYQGIYINQYGLEKEPSVKCKFGLRRGDNYFLQKYGRSIDKRGIKLFSSINDFDIYHPTYYQDFRIKKGNLIVTVYDMIHELYPLEFIGDNTAEKKKNLINKADGIIAISESTKKDLVNILGVSPEKVKVTYLANSLKIDVSDLPVVNEPYILIVGHGSGYKNFIDFVVAYSKSIFSSDLKCICFGGPDFNKDEISLIKSLRLENQIIHMRGDDVLLANLYKYATLFVYPSKYEGFGLPPLEAMYYSTPVLCSNTSSIPEVVGDAGMYFNPDSIEDMTYKMDKFLNSPELLREYGLKGMQREKLFSWDKCATETVKVYDEFSRG